MLCRYQSESLPYFCSEFRNRAKPGYRLRLYILRKGLAERDGWIKTVRAMIFLSWPILALVLSFYFAGRFGKTVKTRKPGSALGLALECFALSLSKNATPLNHYRYQLFVGTNKDRTEKYLFGHEARILLPALNHSCGDRVNDKRRFYETCRQFSVPVPAVYAGMSEQGNHAMMAGD